MIFLSLCNISRIDFTNFSKLARCNFGDPSTNGCLPSHRALITQPRRRHRLPHTNNSPHGPHACKAYANVVQTSTQPAKPHRAHAHTRSCAKMHASTTQTPKPRHPHRTVHPSRTAQIDHKPRQPTLLQVTGARRSQGFFH